MSAPTWYDLLDVEPDAAPGDVRAAWKAAIADLDPTDRRFRTLNEAAAVLLDEDKRAAYDAELAALEEERATEDAEETAEDTAEETAEETDGVEDTVAADVPDGPETDDPGGRTPPVIPTWGLLAAGALALAAVVAAGVVYFGQEKVVTVSNDNVTTSTIEGAVGKQITRNHDLLVEEQGGEALEAAKKAVVPLLSYDYSKMDESQRDAHAVMTKDNREDYDRLFALLVDNVPETKTVVKTLPPVDAGVIRVSEDRVQVLVLVDRQVTNAQRSTPIGYREYAMLTMAEVDGEWLVDKVETRPSQD